MDAATITEEQQKTLEETVETAHASAQTAIHRLEKCDPRIVSYMPKFQVDSKRLLILRTCCGEITTQLYSTETPQGKEAETLKLLAGILGWWELAALDAKFAFRDIVSKLEKFAGDNLGIIALVK